MKGGGTLIFSYRHRLRSFFGGSTILNLTFFFGGGGFRKMNIWGEGGGGVMFGVITKLDYI